MAAKPLANSPFHQGPDDCRSDASARRDPEPRRSLVSAPAVARSSRRTRKNSTGCPLWTPAGSHAACGDDRCVGGARCALRRHFVPVDTESCLRPLARRRLRTARPALRLHPGAESVRAASADSAGLIGALHGSSRFFGTRTVARWLRSCQARAFSPPTWRIGCVGPFARVIRSGAGWIRHCDCRSRSSSPVDRAIRVASSR